MNKDQVSGKFDRAKGHVKQAVGESLGNQEMANQGVVDQAKGAAKETWGNVKEAAHDQHDQHDHPAQSHEQAAEDKAGKARAKVSSAIEQARKKINEKIDAHKQHPRKTA